MRAKTINMFEWKVFESKESNVDSLNLLLDLLAHKGWDIVQVDFDAFSVLARKQNTLFD
jgi:hypothetical protein